MADLSDDVALALKKAFGKQAAERRKSERQHHRYGRMYQSRSYSTDTTVKETVFSKLAEAIRKVSDNGQLRYTARQLFYAIRPLVEPSLANNIARPKKLDYNTFKLYLDEWDEEPRGIIYDPRGHFIEPHSVARIVKQPPYAGRAPLEVGTLEAEEYDMPKYLYNKVLYVEKEGFNIILEDAKIKEKFDLAILSSKGFSTRAIKTLLSKVEQDATILVLHDADIYGYSIVDKLRQETRSSRVSLNLIDIGLNLADAEAMDLEEEELTYAKKPCDDATINRLTDEELQFFFPDIDNPCLCFPDAWRNASGKRIEINAMLPQQLIEYIEEKLVEHHLTEKVMPPQDVLNSEHEEQVSRYVDAELMRVVIEVLEEKFGEGIYSIAEDFKLDLAEKKLSAKSIKEELKDDPERLWFHIVEKNATDAVDENEEDLKDLLRDHIEEGKS